jgi:hypothetical protein
MGKVFNRAAHKRQEHLTCARFVQPAGEEHFNRNIELCYKMTGSHYGSGVIERLHVGTDGKRLTF